MYGPVRFNCSILLHVEFPISLEMATAHLVTFPFSRSTCACESASAASQHQQAVFHRGVTEACEIRAESAQNNRAKPRDNPQPKHQREMVGRSSLPASTKNLPPRKTEMGHKDYWYTSATILQVSWDDRGGFLMWTESH